MDIRVAWGIEAGVTTVAGATALAAVETACCIKQMFPFETCGGTTGWVVRLPRGGSGAGRGSLRGVHIVAGRRPKLP